MTGGNGINQRQMDDERLLGQIRVVAVSRLGPYKPTLLQRWNAGCHNTRQLADEFRFQGWIWGWYHPDSGLCPPVTPGAGHAGGFRRYHLFAISAGKQTLDNASDSSSNCVRW